MRRQHDVLRQRCRIRADLCDGEKNDFEEIASARLVGKSFAVQERRVVIETLTPTIVT